MTKTEIKSDLIMSSGFSDDLFHVTCCDESLALCGLDVSTYPETDGEGELHCVVCADLDTRDIPCSPICLYID